MYDDKYEYYHNSILSVIVKQPDMIFLNTFLCMMSLYPCLYKMASVTRYPLIEFGYDNLNLLGNELESCQRITLASNDLR
jgi:hypothetical protein